MKKILLIFLLTALFVTWSVTKRLKNITDESWEGLQRAHQLADDIHPRYVHGETPGQYCLCSKIYDPICASNNESYFNLCYLECKVPKSDNVSVVHQGNCIPF